MSDVDRRPCGSGGRRHRSAVATDVTGTEGRRSVLARCGARYPTAAAEREMVEESQGQGGLDREIRVPPLPTPPAAPAGRPGSDGLRGQPHRHIAASNECSVVGRPVRNAVLCLVPGMDLRLHPCSVAPAEGPEKCGPRRPTRAGPSCNNALCCRRVAIVGPPRPPAHDFNLNDCPDLGSTSVASAVQNWCRCERASTAPRSRRRGGIGRASGLPRFPRALPEADDALDALLRMGLVVEGGDHRRARPGPLRDVAVVGVRSEVEPQ